MISLPIEKLRELLTYNPDTGLFFWKVQRNGKTKAGMQSGTKSKLGYINLRIDYRTFSAHRVAWAIHYGQWPDGDIDHINGVRDDNRIVNLRNVSRGANLQNQRRAHKDSKTGLLGVSANSNGTFSAKIMSGYHLYKLGSFPTAEEASAAYQAAKLRLHDQPFAGTPVVGTPNGV
jgi:HNH endonuclease